jgi:hypothetical protein
VCDASYLCQVERLEREVLSQVALLPHLEEDARKQIPTVDKVRAEFDAWLSEIPEQLSMSAADADQLTLYRLLGVAKGR